MCVCPLFVVEISFSVNIVPTFHSHNRILPDDLYNRHGSPGP